MVYELNEPYPEYLAHHGIIGQKWGIRRFQNPDGTLTAEGRARYYGEKETKRFSKIASGVGQKGRSIGKFRRSDQIKIMASKMSKDFRSGAESGARCQKQYNKVANSFDFMAKWSQAAVKKQWKELDDYDKGYKGKPINSYDKQDSVMLSMGYIPQYYMIGSYRIKSFTMDRPFASWLLDSGDVEAKQFRKDMKNYNATQERNYQTCRKMIDAFTGKDGMSSLTAQEKENVYTRGVEAAESILNKQLVKEANEQYRQDYLNLLRS